MSQDAAGLQTSDDVPDDPTMVWDRFAERAVVNGFDAHAITYLRAEFLKIVLPLLKDPPKKKKTKHIRNMKPIPVSAARAIAEQYGYDQVVVYARRVGEHPEPHGEHMTTYGIDREHCKVAAMMGDHLKYEVMGWERENVIDHA